MSIDSAIYDHLVGDAAIAALVSTRIYPDTAPQGVTRPYITFFAVATEPEAHAGGGSALADVSIQIDAWAATSVSRRAVSAAIFDRLHGFTGSMGDELLAVRSCTLSGPTNSYDRPRAATESGVFRARHDARVWHVESVPTF